MHKMKEKTFSNQNYVLLVLCLVAVVNFTDRQVLAILLDPIKKDLGVGDTAMGLLTGTAFSICYVLSSFPIAQLGDRGSRPKILGLCVLLWSGMTAVSGVVTSYAQLAVARAGVAVGESGAVPISQSLAADIFPKHKLATVIGILTAAGSFGMGAGLYIGGTINAHFGWRMAMFVVGIPGCILGLLLLLTVKDPRQKFTAADLSETGQVSGRVPHSSVWQVIRHMWKIGSFRQIMAIAFVTSLASYGIAAWAPTFMVRVHGMTTAQVGLWMGLATIFGTGSGNLMAGFLADRLSKRDQRWYAGVAAFGAFISVPFGAVFALVGLPMMAAFAYFLLQLFKSLWLSPTYAMGLALSPPSSRASTSAVITALINLAGLGLGPLLIGMMNDLLAARFGEEGIRYSVLVMVIALSVSGLLSLRLMRSYRADLKAVQA